MLCLDRLLDPILHEFASVRVSSKSRPSSTRRPVSPGYGPTSLQGTGTATTTLATRGKFSRKGLLWDLLLHHTTLRCTLKKKSLSFSHTSVDTFTHFDDPTTASLQAVFLTFHHSPSSVEAECVLTSPGRLQQPL